MNNLYFIYFIVRGPFSVVRKLLTVNGQRSTENETTMVFHTPYSDQTALISYI
jgi:hypothetical protein